MRGRVQFFNSNKFFGFVKPDDGGHDLYCGGKDLEDVGELRKGDIIEFETGNGPDGRPRAKNVTLIQKSMAIESIGGR